MKDGRRQTLIRRIIAAVSVALVMLVGVGIGVVAGDDDEPSGTTPAGTLSQVASVRAGCERWLDARPDNGRPSDWCSRMSDWMRDHMRWSDRDDGGMRGMMTGR